MGAAGPGVTAVDTVQTAVRDKQRGRHGGEEAVVMREMQSKGQGEEKAHTHTHTTKQY